VLPRSPRGSGLDQRDLVHAAAGQHERPVGFGHHVPDDAASGRDLPRLKRRRAQPARQLSPWELCPDVARIRRYTWVLITEGLGNAAIGERLSISEKTVRNHISNVFDKPGVWSRAQAIVFARDRGFRA
jgi:DNA-binding NarL/FixJ family response regulator